MKQKVLLIRFAVGSALLAIMSGTIIKNELSAANGWIPITALFIALGYLALLVRSAIGDIDKRLTKIESQNEKK